MTFGEVLCIFLSKQNFDYLSVRVEDVEQRFLGQV